MIFPFFSMIIMGMVVGLVGGWGAILTVPILVYLFHINPLEATYYSLIIVGSTAFVGALTKIKNSEILWDKVITFGIPSLLATYFSRHFLVERIPDHIGLIEKWTLVLLLFGLIMFAAGCSIVCKRKINHFQEGARIIGWKKHLITTLEWWMVGTITGMVGAGGGFLIVPALMALEWLTLRSAVATSLVIITMNSGIGFLSWLPHEFSNEHITLITTSIGLALVGLILGLILQKRIPTTILSKAFGIFTMAMALIMIGREFLSL